MERRAGKQVLTLVTDGAESCADLPAALKAPPTVRIIMILVPSKGPIAQHASEVLSRAAPRWQRIIPGVMAAPYEDLLVWGWADLTDGAPR
jgi:hypothetical protein